MAYVIVIRESKPTDLHSISEVVRTAYLSNTFSSWCNALSRELTFQLIVMSAAILFIFVGVPLFYCVVAIPLVFSIIYAVIYSAYLTKAIELVHSKKPLQCWVAEACEPFIFLQTPECVSYRILLENNIVNEGFDMGNYRRKVIGTVAVSHHLYLENCIWLFRLAVNQRYRHKGVGRALVQMAQNWCYQKYDKLELVVSECQESSRELFINNGFEVKQLYHKNLFGSAVNLLMFYMTFDLNNTKLDI